MENNYFVIILVFRFYYIDLEINYGLDRFLNFL